MCVHLKYCLAIRDGLFVMLPIRTICVYKSFRATFFSNTHLCTRMEAQLVYACLYEMYQQVFFEQEALRILAELNAIEITRITCAHIIAHNFHSNLNRVYRTRVLLKV